MIRLEDKVTEMFAHHSMPNDENTPATIQGKLWYFICVYIANLNLEQQIAFCQASV